MDKILTKFSTGYSYVEDNLLFLYAIYVDKQIKTLHHIYIYIEERLKLYKYAICISVSTITLIILVDAIIKSTKNYPIDIAVKEREITK